MSSTVTPSTLWGHPKGLYLLFFTEMWERFSYYGMRALLVLLLTSATLDQGFGWGSAEALRLYGFYTALIWFTPVIGGWLADSTLGQRKAVVIGGSLMALGHFMMAGPALLPLLVGQLSGVPAQDILQSAGVSLGSLAPGGAAWHGLDAHIANMGVAGGDVARYQSAVRLAYMLSAGSFYLALCLLVCGVGLFKANISTQVGLLYGEGDRRRDNGFTIFYMGINIGAFFGMIIAGALGEKIGWHYGFTAAGIGMCLGLAVFLWQHQRLLGDLGLRPVRRETPPGAPKKTLTVQERDRLKVIVVLSLFTIVCWVGIEQAGGLLNIYAYHYIDRMLFGFEVPATWFGSLNPLIVFLFAPVFAGIWTSRDKAGKPMGTPGKFALALVLLGLGYLFMIGAILERGGDAAAKASMIWLVGFYLITTWGELCFSPIGLSLVTKLAPARYVGSLMGVWFLCTAAGSFVAGQIGAVAEEYGHLEVFIGLVFSALVAAGFLVLLSGRLVDWMHGAEGIARAP